MENYICIDIGGTAIKYGTITSNGSIIMSGEIDTEASKEHLSILDKLYHLIDQVLSEYNPLGICISTAGMVDPDKGNIFYSGPQIPNYTGTELKQLLESRYHLPVEVENDVNCAGLAEVISGAAIDSQLTLCLTIGTGIGGCILLGKDIFHGFSNSACEVGYMELDGKELQEIASTSALVNKVQNLKNEDNWNGVKIFAAATAGDSICIQAIDEMVQALGRGLANICYVINPEVIVLGGGIMAQEGYLKDKIIQSLDENMLPIIRGNTKLVFAKHKNNAGMLGAFYNFIAKQTNNK